MTDLILKVEQWARDKDLLKKENSQAQMCKVMEELGETASALLKGDRVKLVDGIGDTLVTLIIFASQNGLALEECLQAAWDEIKDRKGNNVDGIFIKSEIDKLVDDSINP